VSENPPPLLSPVGGLTVRAVLDQDATMTAGLAFDPDGNRVVLLIANQVAAPDVRDGFRAWGRTLVQAGRTAPLARIVDHGVTPDGRPYLASAVHVSLADRLRRSGQPAPSETVAIGATIADALDVVHGLGLAHGAVSPATILLAQGGARLGGFGVTAPGLTGPLGIWAFTPPEHRRAATAGERAASPEGDVFALAATLCVALAGVLPWSDPATWADAAGVPSGRKAPAWAQSLRAALSPDPSARPATAELATALRSARIEPVADFHPAKADLRGLIPRRARRLAAVSVDAMADADAPASGRAVVPSASRLTRARAVVRRHSTLVAAALVILALGSFAAVKYLGGSGDSSGTQASAYGSGATGSDAHLLGEARSLSESFLHRVGSGDASVCSLVHGVNNVSVPMSPAPISCQYLMANESQLLTPAQLAGMRNAHVLEAVSITSGSLGAEGTAGTGNAFVSLPYVPSLANTFNRLEITMIYHDGGWYVAQVTLA